MAKVRMSVPDPQDLDVHEPRRRAGRPGMSRKRIEEAAYLFVKQVIDLDSPIIPATGVERGSSVHPSWAVERAILRLVKDGVFRGPVRMPRTQDGKMVIYRHSDRGIGSRAVTGNVLWAEGAWREVYYYFTPGRALTEANRTRQMIRRKNWDAKRYEHELRAAAAQELRKGVPPPRRRRMIESHVPSMSDRARVREYFRGLRAVDWDGTAYVPVPGPAMDALVSWRASFPRPEKPTLRVRYCKRCCGSFPKPSWIGRRAHSVDECNVLIVTRIMTE